MDINVALIGYGEAGGTFARSGAWSAAARVYDIAQPDALYARDGVTGCPDIAGAVSNTPHIISVVTADQAMIAAQNAAQHIMPNALYMDMNSVAPSTKCAAAKVIEAAGGHYIDVAIMSPVQPACMAAPLSISGKEATDAQAALSRMGFQNIKIVGDEIGRASTIKMLRSILYKGVEALTAECLLACEIAGVTDEVLGSFGNDWSELADYRLDRMMVHGARRSAEMAESAKTLEDLGVDPIMTRGTVKRQAEIAAHNINPVPKGLDAKLKRLSQ